MLLEERLSSLVKLGRFLADTPERIDQTIRIAEAKNRWFTKDNCIIAVNSIIQTFLDSDALQSFTSSYKINDTLDQKRIGLVLAGNIPMVGFHDILCTFLSGHICQIKLSEKDNVLIPFFIECLKEIDDRTAAFFVFTERLRDFDAVIATGSDNSAMYFESYFSKYPHIIRRNRHAVAVLTGKESEDDLMDVGRDVFRYFGLGCRSISKVYVPDDYDFNPIMAQLDHFKDIMNHSKYKNNFDYNRSIYLLNGVEHFVNDCIMMVRNDDLMSRIATIHYEYYSDYQELIRKLAAQKDQLQCVSSSEVLTDAVPFVGLGQSQCPNLVDFADGVDTMQFLLSL